MSTVPLFLRYEIARQPLAQQIGQFLTTPGRLSTETIMQILRQTDGDRLVELFGTSTAGGVSHYGVVISCHFWRQL